MDTIVLGLDGANWNLLKPWLDVGKLPNIASLKDTGTTAKLKSCLPPVTCPNWRCYSTGKNPGKLGVFWWEKIDTKERTLTPPTSRSFKSANYWDYLADDGFSTGVVNLPMTYPPLPMDDGFLVAGGPGSEQENYTDPRGIADELDDRGYRLHPDLSVTSKSDYDAADDVLELIDDRLAIFRDLIDERNPDVAHCTVFYINVLQHYFWRDEPTERAWKVIDEHIGAIRETYPDATLFLMSDHGCQEIETMFYANSWLEREGFLRTTGGLSSFFDRVGINQDRILRITDGAGLTGVVSRLVPESIKELVPADDEGVKRDRKLEAIDWTESTAIASGQGLLYVLDGSEETRIEIIERLEELESDITGKPIARSVHRREDAYKGPYVDEAPHVVFDQTPGVHTSGGVGDNPVFDEVSHWVAENVRTGLFLADGPDLKGAAPDVVSITDVAPTVLHTMGSPIPQDMDGNPLRLFNRSEPDTREPIMPDYVDGEYDETVQDRLEKLGYLQ